MAKAEVLLTRHFDATRRRDLETVVAQLHPDIAFADVLEGGQIVGIEAARGYFERQFAMAGVDISLMRVRRQTDGWVHADVEIALRRPDGRLWSQNLAVIAYLIRDDLIVGIDPQPDPGTR
ncbi:nuclear transport factor 2 family protein [Caulobacter endophyticus]|uniref:SnoaL-like domain-containing protein n=1 Tax=Caulobacter endophyticus TaxID=2172652 RepID=A0A2T9KD62_9CAUL|nr:nuclear transport factor 2 family protein [Caulobacter endophyticus]PVM93781.1 hypothetical protein DDF67_02400 [Caulobacter endophyticus]